jgi:hypothetical protein
MSEVRPRSWTGRVVAGDPHRDANGVDLRPFRVFRRPVWFRGALYECQWSAGANPGWSPRDQAWARSRGPWARIGVSLENRLANEHGRGPRDGQPAAEKGVT